MFCQNCGAYNPDNALNCAQCGVPLMHAPPYGMQQPPYGMQPPVVVQEPKPTVPGKVLSIVGMSLGIASIVMNIVFGCFIFSAFLSIPLAIAALVLSIVGMAQMKKAEGTLDPESTKSTKVFAIVGIATGGVSIVLPIVFLLLVLFIPGLAGGGKSLFGSILDSLTAIRPFILF